MIDSLPEDTEEINVCNRGLTSLDVTRFKKLRSVLCDYNRLTSLHLNENLQVLFCDHNKLTSLHLNENLQGLFCYHNQLTSLHLNTKLEKLNCSHNRLTSLYLNAELKMLYCNDNQLTFVYLNEKIEKLDYSNNPIYEMGDIKKLRVLNRFRYLYYCLKYKKRFRDWLWVKIREPKIREKYSHDYLVANLREDTDLDEFLEKW